MKNWDLLTWNVNITSLNLNGTRSVKFEFTTLIANGQGAQDGLPNQAQVHSPRGIVTRISTGEIYFGENNLPLLRKIDPITFTITTLVGPEDDTSGGLVDGIGTIARFREIERLSWQDAEETLLLISDQTNSRIRLVDVESLETTTVAGGGAEGDGLGTNALFIRPRTVNADVQRGYAYVGQNGKIRALKLNDYEVTTIAGDVIQGVSDGIGTAVRIREVQTAELRNGFLYFVDEVTTNFNQMALRRLNVDSGEVVTLIRTGDLVSSNSDLEIRGGFGIILSPLDSNSDPTSIITANHRDRVIHRVDLANQTLSVVAGVAGQSLIVDGVGTNARFELGPEALHHIPGTNRIIVAEDGALREMVFSTPPTPIPTTSPTTETASPTSIQTPSPTITPQLSVSVSISSIVLHESFPPWDSSDINGEGTTTFFLTNNRAPASAVQIVCTSSDETIVRVNAVSPNFGSGYVILPGEEAPFIVESTYDPLHVERYAIIECMVSSETVVLGIIKVPVSVRDVVWPIVTDWQLLIRGNLQVSSLFEGGYTVTVSGSTNITALIESNVPAGTIYPQGLCPSVTVGGLQAPVTSCTFDSVDFITPAFQGLCEVDETECGYQTIQMSYPDGLISSGLQNESAGGIIVCDGSCPIMGRGFYYTSTCVGFTAPELCARIENDPSGCAFGSGDNCRPCSENAFCPGGSRMWPRVGYWTSSESVGTVVRCPPPAETRCQGWDEVRSEPDCAQGYEGNLCGSCSNGFYEQLNECIRCPDSSENILRIFILIIVAALLFVVVYAGLVYSDIGGGKEEYKDLITWQAKDFVIWTILILQLFSVVTSTAGANASAATTLLAWINVVSLDFQAVGPECFSTSDEAFLREYLMFSVILFALIATALLSGNGPCSAILNETGTQGNWGSQLKTARGYLMTMIIFLYTPATFLAAGASYCIPSNDENDGDTLVSWANPNFECGGPTHLPVMTLGLIVLSLYSIAFPIWSYMKIRGVYKSNNLSKFGARHYRKFFGDDYYPQYYWVLQCQMLLSFTLCLTRVYLSNHEQPEQLSKLIINVIAISTFLALVLHLRPHVRHMAWKLPVQISLMILLIFVSLLEFFNYLFLEQQAVSRSFVEGFSYFILCLALLNFMLLGYSFWFVVIRKKEQDYYIQHFMIQRQAPGQLSRRSGSVSRIKRGQSKRGDGLEDGQDFNPVYRHAMVSNGFQPSQYSRQTRNSLSATRAMHYLPERNFVSPDAQERANSGTFSPRSQHSTVNMVNMRNGDSIHHQPEISITAESKSVSALFRSNKW